MALSRSARCGFFWFSVALTTLIAREAAAQTTTTSSAAISIAYETSLPRVNSEGKQLEKRTVNLTPEAVSYQDCVDDQRIRFTLLLSGYAANAGLEVWAANSGQDCSAATNRGSTTQQCWKVYDSAIPLQPQVNVDIPVRRIMSGVTPFTPTAPDSSSNVCGKVDLANISVEFLYFDPGNLSQAAVNKTVAVTADTVGPAAPTGLSVLPGNTRIQVRWSSISGGNPDAGTSGGLTELTGVNIYCDLASSQTTTTTSDASCDAATTDDAGEDAGDAGDDAGDAGTCEGTTTTTTSSCASSNLAVTDGGTVIPSAAFNGKYLCGSYTGNSGTSVVATSLNGKPLTNGTDYAVAVAATDKYGNVGPLSSVLCDTPQETTDFWEIYRSAGGLGGGCATAEGSGFPLASLSVSSLLAFAGLSIVRRRRNRR